MPVFLSRRGFLKGIIYFSVCFLRGISPLKNAFSSPGSRRITKEDTMILPRPEFKGKVSVEEAIKSRRTIRSFRTTALSIEQLSQLLYSAQRITDDGGFKRSAPSGGALYPLDVYAVVGEGAVKGIDAGVYHYIPHEHSIELVTPGDRRRQVARASLHQMWMASAPVNFVITAEYARITSKYGQRGIRYAVIEVGHVGQNIFLQAEALGLRAGIVGAFDDADVIKVMGIPLKHEPLLIMPVGYGG